MTIPTIIPAQPGFTVKTREGKTLPVIGWVAEPFGDGSGIGNMCPLVPGGYVFSPYTVMFEGKKL